MSSLLSKLEALVDEVTALVREERQRRSSDWFNHQPPRFYGQNGTQFRLDHPLGERPHLGTNWQSNQFEHKDHQG